MRPKIACAVLLVAACTSGPTRGRGELNGIDGEEGATQSSGSVSLGTTDLSDGFSSEKTITLSVSGEAALYCYKLDNEAWSAPTPITTALVKELLANGNHVLSVASCSADGAIDESSISSVSFTLSNPDLSLTVTKSSTDPGTVHVVSSDAAVDQIRVSIDGAPFGAAVSIGTTSPRDFSVADDGEHTIRIITHSSLGWADEGDALVFSWTAYLPSIALMPAPGAGSGYSGTVTGDAQTYSFSLDGAPYTMPRPLSVPLSLTDLFDGAHTLLVQGAFASGIETNMPIMLAWVVDATPPNASSIAFTHGAMAAPIAPASTIGGSSFDIAVVDPDATAFTYTVTKDGNAVGSGQGTSAANVPVSGNGVYVVSVTATDSAGNPSAPISLSFTLNQQPVIATFEPSLGPGEGQSSNASAAQFVVVDEATVASAFALDWTLTRPSASAVTGTTGFSGRLASIHLDLATGAQGTYSLSARARDSIGNESALQTRTFMRDTTPPPAPVWSLRDQAQVDIVDSEVINDSRFPLRLSFDRTGLNAASLISFVLTQASTLVVREIDSDTLTAHTLHELPDGAYTVVAVARDAAGSYSAISSDFNFSVDRTPPPRAILSNLPGGAVRLQSSGSGFSLTASSVGAAQFSFRSARADGSQETTVLQASADYTRAGTLAPGHWFVEVSAIDSSGNPQASPTRYDWINEVGLANAWYVSPTGNDANDCASSPQACASIQRAIDVASTYRLLTPGNPEQIVKVEGGSYTAVGTAAKAGVHVLGGFDASFARTGAITILDASGATTGSTVTIPSFGVVEIVIDGLSLLPPVSPTGATTTCVVGSSSGSASLLHNSCALPADKEVTAFWMEPASPATHVVVRENTVLGDSTQARGTGAVLVLSGADAVVSDNDFAEVQTGVDISLMDGAEATDVVVSNNKLNINSHSVDSASDPEPTRHGRGLLLTVSQSLAAQPVSNWRHAVIDHNTMALGSHALLGLAQGFHLTMGSGGLHVIFSDNQFGDAGTPLEEWTDYDAPSNRAEETNMLSKAQLGMPEVDSVQATRNTIYMGALGRRGPMGTTGLCSAIPITSIPVVTRNEIHMVPLGVNCAGSVGLGSVLMAAILADDSANQNELNSNTVVWKETAEDAFPVGIRGQSLSAMFNDITIDDEVTSASRGTGVLLQQAKAGSRVWANNVQARNGIHAAHSLSASDGAIDVRNNAILAQRRGIYSQNAEPPPLVLVEDNDIVIGESGFMSSQSGILVYSGKDASLRRNSVQWTTPTVNGSGVFAWAAPGTQIFSVSDNKVMGGSYGIQAWGVSGATMSVFNNRISSSTCIQVLPSSDADGTVGVAYVENNNVLATYSGVIVANGVGALAFARVSNNIMMGSGATIGLDRNRELDGPAFRAFNNTISGFTNAFTDFDTCSGCSVGTLNSSIYGYRNVTTPATMDVNLETKDTTDCALLTGGVDTSQRVRSDARLSLSRTELTSERRTVIGTSVSCASKGVSIGAFEID